jgi:hypothetical protein
MWWADMKNLEYRKVEIQTVKQFCYPYSSRNVIECSYKMFRLY